MLRIRGREGGREERREGEREGGREGGRREGGRKGRKEGGRVQFDTCTCVSMNVREGHVVMVININTLASGGNF